jgi:transposase
MELCMNRKERDRLKVMHNLKQGRLKQREAAEVLALSERQVRRLLRRYERGGDAGLVHGLRGRPSARKIAAAVRVKALGLMRERYADFGPTLAAEYLAQEQKLTVSRETLRQWMTAEGLWQARPQRVRHRQWRERKACWGELVQMDTSIHDWFEGRGDPAVLITMIDDASSRAWMRFFPAEGTRANLEMLRSYLKKQGRPVAIYADKASHFLTTRQAHREEALAGRDAETQIARALRELGIRYIAAHSPQAKGRVERSFGTAQDRLVKGMRLAGVRTVAEGNRYLDKTFLPLWQRRFTIRPASAANAHRSVNGYDVNAILSVQARRTVANDYTLRYQSKRYQIVREAIQAGLRGAAVIVEERLDGSMRIRWRHGYLKYRELKEGDERGVTNISRALAAAITPFGLRPHSVTAAAKAPPPDHPWKRTLLLCRKADISTLR